MPKTTPVKRKRPVIMPIHKVRKALQIKRELWAEIFNMKYSDVSALEGGYTTTRYAIKYPPEWFVDAVCKKFFVQKDYLIGKCRLPWKTKEDELAAIAKKNRIINGISEESKEFDCAICKNNTKPEVCNKCDIDIHSLFE